MITKNLGAIILAAGKGKRMRATSINKVVFQLGEKPIIMHIIELLELLAIPRIVVVVGFAKKSVEQVLRDKSVLFVEQKKRLGTAHAVSLGLSKISNDTQHVLVLQGDDSVFYTASILKKLVETHLVSNASCTLLTIEVDNPKGLGRIIRDQKGAIAGIVEEKDATAHMRKITEINPACYIFNVSFLKKYLKKIKKSTITGEYYLTSLIDIAVSSHKKIETVAAGKIPWRGINTPDELLEAEKLFSFIHNYGTK